MTDTVTTPIGHYMGTALFFVVIGLGIFWVLGIVGKNVLTKIEPVMMFLVIAGLVGAGAVIALKS